MPDLNFFKKARVIAGHKCNLSQINKDVVDRIVSEGYLVGFRRYILRYFMVDQECPQSKEVFRSTARIDEERNRHMFKHPYVVHPFSRARYHWECLMIFVYFLSLTMVPIVVVMPESPLGVLYITFFLNFMCWCDMFIRFNTGFFDRQAQRVELGYKRIAQKYITGFFIFDFLSSIPFNFILQTLHLIIKDGHITPVTKIRWFSMFKLLRMFTLIRYIRRYYDRRRSNFIRIKAITFGLGIFVAILWSCAIKTVILEHQRSSSVQSMYERFHHLIEYLVLRFHRLLKEMLLVGYERGDKLTIKDDVVMVMHVILLLLGFVFYLILIVKMMNFSSMKSSSGSKYSRLLHQIAEYMRYKELPPALREKIMIYINFKFQKHMYKESEIMKTISGVLKQDLLLHNCKTLVEKVEFFRDIPESVMLRIIVKLRTEVYLSNDVIFQAGETGASMYFIYLGTVAIYAPNGVEICHLHEGDNFGEIALFINKSRTATVVAITECEVFKLSRKDLFEALEPYPEIIRNIKTIAMERLKSTIALGGG